MNNSTGSETDSGGSKYVIVMFMCLINLVAVIGNVSIIIVVLRCFQLRHTLTNFFVLNLSIVDFLASVVALPMSTATFLHESWSFDSDWCIANGFISCFSIYASICSLCVISIERYYSIKLPMHHAAHMSLQKTIGAILYIWVQSLCLAIMPVFGLNSYSYQEHKYCSFTWDESKTSSIFVLFVSFWCFVIPGVILLIMHCGIFRVAREAARQIRPYPSTPTVSVQVAELQLDRMSETSKHPPLSTYSCTKRLCGCANVDDTAVHVAQRSMSTQLFQHTPRPNRGHVKAIKTLIIIFSTFMILWGPYFISQAYAVIHGSVPRGATTELLTTWMGYTSFAVNPLLYGWMNRTIRQELISCFQSMCCNFYATHSQTQSDAPREGEDFFQFLERTSYKGSPSQNPATVKNIVNNERTPREPVITEDR